MVNNCDWTLLAPSIPRACEIIFGHLFEEFYHASQAKQCKVGKKMQPQPKKPSA
jgi:hypothetical protein